MIERDFLNVRNLALVLTASPLALLLLFGAIDLSIARFGHATSLTKDNAVSEVTPKLQPTSNDR